MSDVEEPPQKVTKLEFNEEYLEEESLDDGQEEWLSDGILTDDDYQEQNTLNTQNNDTANAQDSSTKSDIKDNTVENSQMEEYLKNSERAEVNDGDDDGDDDGNDTDDLLRMLGDENKRNKKQVLKIVGKKKPLGDAQSTDDEYIFEGAKVTKLKVAKNAIITTQKPTKAEPEDMSDDDVTDVSSDEASMVQKMFTAKKNVAAKSTSKPAVSSRQPQRPINFKVTETSHSTPKSIPNKPAQPIKSLLKPEVKQVIKIEPKKVQIKTQNKNIRTPNKIASKPANNIPNKLAEMETFKEDSLDDDSDFNERDGKEALRKLDKQRIMRPERMDEEFLSDEESSISDDDSLYDELPSSESEDIDEWFTLDIRSERAGDYVPLLGDRALDILSEQKRHVSSRLATLRQSLAALTESGRQQAEHLRKATLQLVELDAMLKAT